MPDNSENSHFSVLICPRHGSPAAPGLFGGSMGRERYLLRPMHLLAELNIINKYKNAINCKKVLVIIPRVC